MHASDQGRFLDREPVSLLFGLLQDLNQETRSYRDFTEELQHRSTQGDYAEISTQSLRESLTALAWVHEVKVQHPYSLLLYLTESAILLRLCYPDLAVGAAYKALLLADAAREESDEYHESAVSSLSLSLQEQLAIPTEKDEATHASSELLFNKLDIVQVDIYAALSTSLLQCKCFQSSHQYVLQGLQHHPDDTQLKRIASEIEAEVQRSHTGTLLHASKWQDSSNVRRERYPWNTKEPQRLQELEQLNAMMHQVAPKLDVKAVALPNLVGSSIDAPVVMQLGVFANEDLSPGEVVLEETSLLTANNRLQDAICDACNADLPDLVSAKDTSVVGCSDCEVVFCSQKCHDLAQELYHPALCDRDVEAIAKDSPPEQAADALYALLLLRALAMAETQDLHPLDLPELKYIWGDFNEVNADKIFSKADEQPAPEAFPATLPFSFEYGIRLPFHMLEKMDIDIFANPQYDVWVFNTLYAKFRGTASARLSGRGGRAIRGPEVCAVHPMWCLANHSCDPNVSWQWGGSIAFHVRGQRAAWSGKDGKIVMHEPGVRKGEEILNHYCDLDLPVGERRAWARGALGGDCMCARCVWEAEQLQA